MNFRQSQQHIAKIRYRTFIVSSREHLVQNIISHCTKICFNTHNKSIRILFSFGVDAIIIFKAWNYFKQLEAIVGGIKTNHFLGFSDDTGKEIISIQKECVEVKHVYVYDEVNVIVITLHPTSLECAPILFLLGILRPSISAITLARLL